MKTRNMLLSTGAVLALLLLVGTLPALADRGEGGWSNMPRGGAGPGNSGRWDNGPHGGAVDRGRRDMGRGDNGPGHDPCYQLDSRYHHDRYYPPRGFAVDTLPRGYRVVPYHGTRYYFYGGVWYRPYGAAFVVITPPIGIIVPVLPPFYTTIWVGAFPYYYADGVYYVWRPVERGYAVAETPPEPAVATTPPTPEQLFIYPKNRQNEQQQANDRYDCHRWAAGQTGFDPTQPVADLSAAQLAPKRADYQRAMTACLEARGYSVK